MRNNTAASRLPEWLRKPAGASSCSHEMKRRLRAHGLHTVCEEARCPNIGECFSRGTATLMIMGDLCTRSCRFCAVKHGTPEPLDPGEPERVAAQIAELGLSHAVITSVTRDDLPDGGAAHFAATILKTRSVSPGTVIEVLTPDFEGRDEDIATVCEAGPDIFNHNIETIERLTPQVRSSASYRRSLAVLFTARKLLPKMHIKSGLMVGLGETPDEVDAVLADLAKSGCDIVTIGQYLKPAKTSLPVEEYLEPEVFLEYEEMGLSHGIKRVFAGPFVRSSYMADKASLKQEA